MNNRTEENEARIQEGTYLNVIKKWIDSQNKMPPLGQVEIKRLNANLFNQIEI